MQRAKEKQDSKKQGIERKGTGRKDTGRKERKGRQSRKGLTFWRFGWAGRRKVRRQIKDRLFRFLFEKDKGHYCNYIMR